MNEAFGQQLENKVTCIGLHGDYEAGLKFIREGKLSTLRHEANAVPHESQFDESALITEESSMKSALLSSSHSHPDSMLRSASGEEDILITPGTEVSPLPSFITDEDVTASTQSGRSWSDVEGEIRGLNQPGRLLRKTALLAHFI